MSESELMMQGPPAARPPPGPAAWAQRNCQVLRLVFAANQSQPESPSTRGPFTVQYVCCSASAGPFKLQCKDRAAQFKTSSLRYDGGCEAIKQLRRPRTRSQACGPGSLMHGLARVMPESEASANCPLRKPSSCET